MAVDVLWPFKKLGIHIIRLFVPLVVSKPPASRPPNFKTTFQHSLSPSKQALDLHVYEPLNASEASAKPLPLYVNLHQAGFVLDLFPSDEQFCSWLADAVPCVVLDADYSKAPEHPWPAGPDDAHAAVLRAQELAKEHGWDAHRVAIGGFSSGGCLALVEASSSRHPLTAVVAFFPSTRLDQEPSEKPTVKKPSRGNAGGDVPASVRKLFYSVYMPKKVCPNRADPRVSPYYADAARFPSSVTIITAEHDSLRAEGESLAEKLHQARPGICKLWMAEGQGHAWVSEAKPGTNGDQVKWDAFALVRDRLQAAFA